MNAIRIATALILVSTPACVGGLLGGGGSNLLGSWTAESFIVSVPGFPAPLNMMDQGGAVTVTFSGEEDGGTYVAQSSVDGIDPTSSGTWSKDGDRLTMADVPGMVDCPLSVDGDTATVRCPQTQGEAYVIELVMVRAG